MVTQLLHGMRTSIMLVPSLDSLPRVIYRAGFSLDATVRDIVSGDNYVSPHLLCEFIGSFSNYPLHVSPILPLINSCSLRKWVFVFLRLEEPDVDWNHLVWFPQNIPRHACILWVTFKDCLKTHDRIRTWEPNKNLSCNFCHLYRDSLNHQFFECSYPSQIWHEMIDLINLSNVPDKWFDIIDFLK